MSADIDIRISHLLDQLEDPTLPAAKVVDLRERVTYLRSLKMPV